MTIDILKLVEYLSKFNHILEYCEFSRCIANVLNINTACDILLKKEKSYTLILPFVKKIKEKIKPIIKEEFYSDKKIAFIHMLLEHRYYQIAITFTDQLIREELIHYTLQPKMKKMIVSDDEMIKYFPKQKRDASVYKISQNLIDDYGIRYTYPNVRFDIHSNFAENFENLKKYIDKSKDKKNVKKFYEEIRNHINHASKITLSEKEIKEILLSSINFVAGMKGGN